MVSEKEKILADLFLFLAQLEDRCLTRPVKDREWLHHDIGIF